MSRPWQISLRFGSFGARGDRNNNEGSEAGVIVAMAVFVLAILGPLFSHLIAMAVHVSPNTWPTHHQSSLLVIRAPSCARLNTSRALNRHWRVLRAALRICLS